MPSDRPRAASAVLISSIDFSPRFFTSLEVGLGLLHEVGHQVQLGALERVDGAGRQRQLLQRLAEGVAQERLTGARLGLLVLVAARRRPAGRSDPAGRWTARVSASSGLTAPFVHTSRTSFS